MSQPVEKKAKTIESWYDADEAIVITCTAPVNMAVIKYWGKREEVLNLPLNGSISVTLNQADLKTITTIVASKHLKEDEIWLNGEKESIQNVRLQKVLKAIRAGAPASSQHTTPSGKKVTVTAEQWRNDYKIRVVSFNNFPTAAGLASSAAGYSCLVFSLATLIGVTGDVTPIARLGSGSACRSLFGGFVRWNLGQLEDGTDSNAVQIAPETHWPDMHILICVANDQKKAVGSAEGMIQSAKTSDLLKKRVKDLVPERMKQMESYILNRDFEKFADLTMSDSNSFHDVCADTKPPIFYLNDTSRNVISVVEHFNKFYKRTRAAYTFDAGPNATLFVMKKDLPELLALILHFFPHEKIEAKTYFKYDDLRADANKVHLSSELINSVPVQPKKDVLKYILHTTPGPGPQVLPLGESLFDVHTGEMKKKL